MQREIPAPLLRGPAGIESGPQPYSSSSEQYYFAGELGTNIRHSFGASGSSGDQRRSPSDRQAVKLNGSDYPMQFAAQGNRSEVHWMYDLSGGAGLTADTALFINNGEHGGDGSGGDPDTCDCESSGDTGLDCDDDCPDCEQEPDCSPEDCELSLPGACWGCEVDEVGCDDNWELCGSGQKCGPVCKEEFPSCWHVPGPPPGRSEAWGVLLRGDPGGFCGHLKMLDWQGECNSNQGQGGCNGCTAAHETACSPSHPFCASNVWAMGCCAGCCVGGSCCPQENGNGSGCGNGAGGGSGSCGNGSSSGGGGGINRFTPGPSGGTRICHDPSSCNCGSNEVPPGTPRPMSCKRPGRPAPGPGEESGWPWENCVTYGRKEFCDCSAKQINCLRTKMAIACSRANTKELCDCPEIQECVEDICSSCSDKYKFTCHGTECANAAVKDPDANPGGSSACSWSDRSNFDLPCDSGWTPPETVMHELLHQCIKRKITLSTLDEEELIQKCLDSMFAGYVPAEVRGTKPSGPCKC